ncbi:MAG TPA: DUF4019 domain-containing protein [Bryobacteraceae bacterium]|nr:DUF4019 domain-containing protein [Bryobacteraceae bacterium]
MKAVFLLIFAAMLFAAPVNDQASPSGEAWLKLVDGGKYADSWKEASSYFRSRVPEKTWVSMVQGVRAPLGSLVSRSQASVTFAKTLPGAPDGNYALMQFQTSFQKKTSAVETLTMMSDGDQWRVAGYFIR